jgi:hypothetical protein
MLQEITIKIDVPEGYTAIEIDCNLAISKFFTYAGEQYKVKKGNNCRRCAFFHDYCTIMKENRERPLCCKYNREDATNVIFKKEKP